MIKGAFIKYKRIANGMSQAELANGICSTSYLSKIEQGKTPVNLEIAKKLYQVLGVKFIQEKEILHHFDLLRDEIFENTIHFRKINLGEVEKDLIEAMINSERLVDVLIIYALLDIDKKGKEAWQVLAELEMFLTDYQAYWYGYLELTYWDRSSHLLNRDQIGIYNYQVLKLKFEQHDFEYVLCYAQDLYHHFAKLANISGMMHIAHLVSKIHLLENRILQFDLEQNKVANINAELNNLEIMIEHFHDKGWMALRQKNYTDAINFLNQSLKAAKGKIGKEQEVRIKLIMAYVLNGQYSQAKENMEKLPTENKLNQLSLRLFKNMITYKSDFKNNEIKVSLESCYQQALLEQDIFIRQFYGEYLLLAYKCQYRYSKVLHIQGQLM